ncbi:collagen alpha-1(I) chain-like [Cervus elaphus]|uniref:collagen alpha-1(I) chain-like n=1 Tax=Cervus elaphus TaxID=9860 RepID=UPI001CC2A769|nr:collagen alpha-1(I) chain-like [Cervus elaphus]
MTVGGLLGRKEKSPPSPHRGVPPANRAPTPRATGVGCSCSRRSAWIPGAGKRLPDPDLGSASAPCGRPAPDPAGLRRQKRPAEGPGRKLEPRGREGGRSAPRAWLGARRSQGHPGAPRQSPRALESPHVAGRPGPHVEGAEEEGGRLEGRAPGRGRRTPPPPPQPGPARPLPPRPQRVSRASRAGPGRGVPAAPGPLARPPRPFGSSILSGVSAARGGCGPGTPSAAPSRRPGGRARGQDRAGEDREPGGRRKGVARERPRGAGGGPRSEGRSREPCRADPGGPHSRRRRHRRRVGWKGREPPPLPPPPPPPGWAPFAVDAGGPGRGKGGGPGGGLGPPPPPPHLRPRAGGRRARASLRHWGRRRRRAKDTEPASEDIFGLRPPPPPARCPRSALGGWAQARGSLPAVPPPPPRRRSRPLAAVCARIFVVVMRVDECEAPPAPVPRGRWVRARAGAASDPGRARDAPRGQYGRIPRDQESERAGPGACGAGEGNGGSTGKTGRARLRAPRGAAPAGRGSRAAPQERNRATSAAAAAATAAPGSARQSRSGAGARGEPGDGRGRGPSWPGISSARPRSRRHHFLLARRCRGRREPCPPARLPRLPRPGRTFRVGRTQKKKFRRRGWRGRAPGGGDSARRSDSRAAAIASSSLSSAAPDRPARPRGSAFLSLPGALPSAPGQVGHGRARSGARGGPSPAGEAHGVAGRLLPTQRPGAGRPRARELGAVTAGRVETHAHTLPPAARFPPPPMVTDSECEYREDTASYLIPFPQRFVVLEFGGPRAPGNPIVPPRLTTGRLPGSCSTLCCGEGNAGAWVKANPPYLATRYLEGAWSAAAPPRQLGCWALLEGRSLLASGVRGFCDPSPEARPPTQPEAPLPRRFALSLPRAESLPFAAAHPGTDPRPSHTPPPPAGTWKEPGEDVRSGGGPRTRERGSE